ncbi:MAG: hypothetical protein NVS3B1_12740 [Marmoricola sp.]
MSAQGWTVHLCVNEHLLNIGTGADGCPWCGASCESFDVVRAPDDNRLGKSRRDHSATAKAAALDVMPRTGTQRRRVLDFMLAQWPDGMTRDEIAVYLEMSPNTVRPRVKELLDGGFLGTGNETRRSAMGKLAEVVVAIPPTTKGVGDVF